MLEKIDFKKISNDKLELENNEQLFSLIEKILVDYKLRYSDILKKFFLDKNLLKIFRLNRKHYRYIKDSYLSVLSLTYILVYFEQLLQNIYKAHKNIEFVNIFLNNFFDDETKLSYFCNDLVRAVFNRNQTISLEQIIDNSALLLIDTFFTGINKTKLYYNIYFGRVSNKYIVSYKKEVREISKLLDFIYKISKNLTSSDIMFIYNLNKKDVGKLDESEYEILKKIVSNFPKEYTLVKSNLLLEEDLNVINEIPNFLLNNHYKFVFSNFRKSNQFLKKEELEVLVFDCYIGKYTYICKIRKILGSLHFCLYDNEKLIFKNRIYFLEDLNRIIILIKEYNQLRVNEYNFLKN